MSKCKGEVSGRYEVRIRYDEHYINDKEYFVFEGKWTSEDEWGLDTAFPVINDMISYQALTKIRELQRLGIKFYFSK